ncbi:EAL domain-containing protein [Pseudomonas sp. 10S4]|uniref:EAL domain-containing protein n=1 Tax=Pseudomonas sp. 10S4 TaxID=3048583 RepID=UPI002AC9BF31|nr:MULTISPECIES: EAL domain-containing protein [unclassified Pseudomonas]MEB0224017.1 EAL domain-containing protein [Pseudomonas sp. 5S1]MEB0297773.1 EAL domain-containing protein [Pseudomonas sp. 10S4]WPX20057.1 EAL domain-containing protein [Pseudomonas sp. 10S4]
MSNHKDLSQVFIQTLEQSVDSVVVIDSQNRIILFNEASEKLWGYGSAEVLGRNVEQLVPKLIRPLHDSYIDANRRTGINKIVGTSRDVLIECKDGTRRWGSMSISRIDAQGQILYAAFIKDITRQHEEQRRLYLLSLVVDTTENAIVITDASWSIIYVNDGFTQMFGYSAQDVVNKTPIEVLAPYFKHSRIAAIRRQLAKSDAYHGQEFGYDRGGQRVWCNVTTYPVHDAHGHLTNTVSVMIDVTHTRMHEVLRHKMLEAMVREESLQTLMNLACVEVQRIAPEVIATVLRVDGQGLLHTLAAPGLPSTYSRALDGTAIGPESGSCGAAAFSGESVMVSDIATHPYWDGFRDLALPIGLKACWSTPIKSSDGRVLGTFAFYYREAREPSPLHHLLVNACIHLCALALEREESRLHIRQLAFYDDLTGLANRNLLHARAEQAIAQASRHQSSLAVVFIDLDRFKQVNDSLGHPAGDEFLRVIANRLSERRRESDIVSRLSGDEFVLVLPQCSLAHATDLIEQLRGQLSAPCQISGVTLKPSVSIGVSMFPDDGRTMEVLLHRADMAMYQAKTSGRGRVCFFSDGLDQLAQGRLRLEAALREAIDGEALHLVYQPQIDLCESALYGIEALARWTHPQLGDVSPTCFIPLAEECGLIGEFGLWALREACGQLASWRRQGLRVPTVSVNMSPTNFHNRNLSNIIARTLEQHGLQAKDLTLEITESVLMDTNPDTLTTIEEVHALGVSLAMDDFGTGYSSLSYLRRMPIQELKLDRSFVHDLESDTTSQALSEAVIRIGESLHLRVVAEGIETIEQQRILLNQGYRIAQGFLISRPLAAKDLGRWLEKRYAYG